MTNSVTMWNQRDTISRGISYMHVIVASEKHA